MTSSTAGQPVLPFEFIVEGPAISQQTRRRSRLRKWIELVRQSAQVRWPIERPPVAGSLMLRVSYLYEDVVVDLDNLPKPIIDALKDVVYVDDNQITDILLLKRDLRRPLRVENPSDVLAGALDLGKVFLHILIDHAPDQEVVP